MSSRFSFALPFAVLASLVAGCGSTAGSPSTPDTGTQPEAAPHPEAGTDAPREATPPADAPAEGKAPDAAPPIVIVPAAGSKQATTFVSQIVGVTADDYVVFYNNNTGDIGAADINGTATTIISGAPGEAGNNAPQIVGMAGNIVAILSNYSTKTVSGNIVPIAGTLSIWSHTLGALKQISTTATGIITVASDSSYMIYTDGADSTGTKGNISIVKGDGTGAAVLASAVVIDFASTTCSPWAAMDKTIAVVSSCALLDGGANGAPQVISYDSASAWAPTVLLAGAAVSSPFAGTGVVNFTTDTSGTNALVVSPTPLVDGGTVASTIAVQGLKSTTPLASLSAKFGAPTASGTNGAQQMYLSNASAFAVFTETNGALWKAAFSSPTTAPTVSTLVAPGDGGAGGVFGWTGFSSDEKYLVDYTNPLATGDLGPTSLNLVNIGTGSSVPLIVPGSSFATTLAYNGTGVFTTDNSYVIFSTGLVTTGNQGASVGTLKVADVASGTVSTLVSTATVWDAAPTTGTKMVYNSNYITSAFSLPNGAASGDIYATDAKTGGVGTLIVAGADAPNNFWLTHDRTHMFYTFSQVQTGDGGTLNSVPGDGIYAVALP